MQVHISYERPMGRVREMLAWCRENRLPLIHMWIEPLFTYDGDHYADKTHWMGTRGLFGMDEDRSHSCYPDDEEFSINFYVRDRDYDLWKLRFS